jgi:hypothetical protein
MSIDELTAYAEAVREKNRTRSMKYYDEKIKGAPDKYQKVLDQ